MGIIVAKFGGTSLADSYQFEKVKRIIESDPDRKYVVPSAPGKRFDSDNKVTDLLYLCKTHIEHNVPFDQVFQVICDRYISIAFNLKLSIDLQPHFNEIKAKIINGASKDYIASRGEYLNGLLLAEYLGYTFVDAKDVILFDSKGRFLEEETDDALGNVLLKCEKAVIPGFYGAMPDGSIRTFSRGGSDITGALVAKALKADVYENWTDVSGFLMADPRIVKNPLPIKVITYKELRELSYMGASVLHEDAVFPVRQANIPINIKNTNEPDNPGTVIVSNLEKQDEHVITGIAGKKDFTVIAIYKNRMNSEIGFMRKLLSILEDYNISIEHLPSGIDTLSAVISNNSINGKLEDVLDEIDKRLKPDTVDVLSDMALIATVGYGMSQRRGVAAKLFTALSEAGVNIRMIDQGSSEINIITGVENNDFEKAIMAIYNAFVNE
ncbi:MAG: aspartate kinase [Clostridiales bacterium]|nr:aspartate kinase [Clostridiales bacterium]